LSPAKRRRAVAHARAELRVSERRACRVVGQARATQRYVPTETVPWTDEGYRPPSLDQDLPAAASKEGGLMVFIDEKISIPDEEISLSAIRAQGAGGQNVNKVSSAIHLRFDIGASSLPERVKARLLAGNDQRITQDGVLVIKAQNHRTQEKNRAEAVDRLRELVLAATRVPRKRIPTRPGRAAREKRLDEKKKRGAIKKMRRADFD
jgi:ribosome-associated protein